jgi:hypothetical protein
VNEETVISAKSIKKNTGSYYTPEHLAQLISSETIFAWLSYQCQIRLEKMDDLNALSVEDRILLIKKVNGIKILDPSVGAGVFLLASANLLNNILTALGDGRTENHRKQSIATKNLYGVDLASHAILSSTSIISDWADIARVPNIRQGNTLVGFIEVPEERADLELKMVQDMSQRKASRFRRELEDAKPFHWGDEFPGVFSGSSRGFDIIVGNPPYGNLLGKLERRHITQSYPFNIGGNRTGTWNSAAHFIVRAMSLLKEGGQLGFLVPNSILRVKQFTKTREFLLKNSRLWKIVDEGSPFDGVTLEMVSLFIEKTNTAGNPTVMVESRRIGLKQSNHVNLSVLRNSSVLPIYYDDIFKNLVLRGSRNQLKAGRGRDIPKSHTRKEAEPGYDIPYITSGRSVRRYHLNYQHMSYTDDWFLKDSALIESYESEFLVATKNYRYPRCILKPKGMVHGGGIVKISPQFENADLRALGLILNSRLIRHVSIRYLTNYSQLTCCLNTGIMEELPLVFPERPLVYSILFDNLTSYYSSPNVHSLKTGILLERVADALVYSMYLHDERELESLLADRVIGMTGAINEVVSLFNDSNILRKVDETLADSTVLELERLGDYPPSKKSLRY